MLGAASRALGYAERAPHPWRRARAGEYCVKRIRLFITVRSIMSESATQAPTHEVILTDVAAAKVKSLLEQEGRDDLRLRIAVQPGGCSGLIYQLYFDDRTLDGDAIRSFDGVEVVVDRMSVPYLSGATIDFADTIERQGFTIDNPNAQNTCACGESFH